MWLWISSLSLVSGIGASLGGLLISNRTFPHQFVILSMTAFFTLSSYLGMFLGSFFSWMSHQVVSIIISGLCFAFISVCLIHFHPTLGFFHGEDKITWLVLFSLFCMVGIEVAVFEISGWTILLLTFVFSNALFLGARMQLRILKIIWRHVLMTFLPLVLLLFIAIIKLL